MRPRSSEPSPGRRAVLRGLALAPLAALARAAAPRRAQARSQLDAWRAEGVIAERFDGYVELRVSDAPGEARALVREVNARRRELYRKRADETDVPVEEVGKLFATKIADQAPAGTYFRQPDGRYVRK